MTGPPALQAFIPLKQPRQKLACSFIPQPNQRGERIFSTIRFEQNSYGGPIRFEERNLIFK